MRKSNPGLERLIACFLACLLVVPLTEAATTPLPSAPQPQPVASQPGPASEDADSAPAPIGAGTQQAAQAVPAGQQSQPAPAVGTAAAPAIKAEGVPGSRPAGAAIAPAKQRRIRTFAIRVGILVAAGVAIGTVAAASLGSPARPH